MKSNKYKLNKYDFLKALLMAILTPAIYIIQQSLESGVFVFNWHAILVASASGAVAYLIKNFFEKPSGTAYKIVADEENIDNGLIGTRPKDR